MVCVLTKLKHCIWFTSINYDIKTVYSVISETFYKKKSRLWKQNVCGVSRECMCLVYMVRISSKL